MPDLATFGETMLRLSPPGDTTLEMSEQFDVRAAGAESNVAIAAARLGIETAWLSKLPDSPLGHRVAGAIRHHTVEPAVVWSDEGRQGTYYVESGDQPRGSTVIYDRDDAAVRTATTAELPTSHVADADVFHTTGITPALSDTLEATTGELLERAGDAGTTRTFDVNYRSKLWSPETARETLTEIFPHVDVLFVAQRDAETVLGRTGPAADVARELAAEYGFETTVVTRSSEGAIALRDDEIIEQSVFAASDAHPVGTGDAFVGGFLTKRLQGGTVADALEYGAATAALKRTIPGDAAIVTAEAVQRVIGGSDDDISR